MATDEKKIAFELTSDQALVLFEWMCRTESAGSLPFEHEAEELVIWNIEGQLEHILAEPFDLDYKNLVAAARERVQKLAYGEKVP